MHSHCLAGNIFGANLCECGAVLQGAMQRIAEEGLGAIIYLHHASRGFAVERVDERKVLAFHREIWDAHRPEHQRRTQREIGTGAQILADLNLHRIRLLTNHPRRVAALQGFAIEIVEQVPMPVEDPARRET